MYTASVSVLHTYTIVTKLGYVYTCMSLPASDLLSAAGYINYLMTKPPIFEKNKELFQLRNKQIINGH